MLLTTIIFNQSQSHRGVFWRTCQAINAQFTFTFSIFPHAAQSMTETRWYQTKKIHLLWYPRLSAKFWHPCSRAPCAKSSWQENHRLVWAGSYAWHFKLHSECTTSPLTRYASLGRAWYRITTSLIIFCVHM